VRAAVRRLFYGLRTEGAGARREAAAVGVGIFIGCLPIYGFHLLLCWIVGWMFGLSRLKTYLAANISNPFMAPLLVFTEIQAGAWLRRGSFHPLTVEAVKNTDLSVFSLDVLTGSVAIGVGLGLACAFLTYMLMRGADGDTWFLDLVHAAADRYATVSITAWEFARGKLRADPLYRATVCQGLLPSGGTLVDIGCGSGLTLALLVEARTKWTRGRWSATCHPPPHVDRLVGIELRARPARMAQDALGADATIVQGDARLTDIGPCRSVLLFDVLHLLRKGEQEALLETVGAALEPGGVVLVREANAAGGWRFWLVRVGNSLKALLFGHWGQRFHFRTPDDWLACFAAHGLHGHLTPMGGKTPFANVLFRVERQRSPS
jgi:uncharacterized protein (DUF2062 family)